MIQKNKRHRYASDLSDSQWVIAENRRKWKKCDLVDAELYFVDNGCKPSRNIHPFNGSVSMQNAAKPLSKMFPVNWLLALIISARSKLE